MTGLPSIAVIIPTIEGREEHLATCITGYEIHAPGSYELELIVEHDHPTCGSGWQAGAERATADYLHFSCDDIEPQAGWAQPAVETLAQGFLPAPRVLNGVSGAPEYQPAWGAESPDWTPVHMSCLPFITRDLWENHVRPMLTCHYYTDDWISWRSIRAGYQPRVRRDYLFRHYWAAHKRGAGMSYEARMWNDHSLYQQAMSMVLEGKWDRPWPIVP